MTKTSDDIADNTPVIVGVGQFSERVGEADYAALSPMDLAGKALIEALGDCRADGDAAGALDVVAAIRQFEISHDRAVAPFGVSDNPPRSIAQRVGADPEHAILELTGGQGPQKLVGELAASIAEGRYGAAAIVGSEAISTMLALLQKGDKPDWSEAVGGQLEDRGFGTESYASPALHANGVNTPIAHYAVFENARRAKQGTGLDEYRREIGELFAPFTRVAAANPYAAARTERSAAELAEITPRNRVVAEPYAKLTVSRDKVNQAAAIVLMSAGKARELGISEDRWVHIHAATDASELHVLERPDLARSEAAIASVRDALNIAGLDQRAIGLFDLYSCFAIPVLNIIEEFGIAADDPRGLTLTGGLPFFGGAGNNYSAHAIAEAVARLRADREAYALVGANGGFMSKYATGIYSANPADWNGATRTVKSVNPAQPVAVAAAPNGPATIESYTVVPGKSGARASIIARSASGERLTATSGDEATLSQMTSAEPFGRAVTVSEQDRGRNIFAFTHEN